MRSGRHAQNLDTTSDNCGRTARGQAHHQDPGSGKDKRRPMTCRQVLQRHPLEFTHRSCTVCRLRRRVDGPRLTVCRRRSVEATRLPRDGRREEHPEIPCRALDERRLSAARKTGVVWTGLKPVRTHGWWFWGSMVCHGSPARHCGAHRHYLGRCAACAGSAELIGASGRCAWPDGRLGADRGARRVAFAR